jgi:UDP-N-acetylglucosamine 4,6-dehydratase
MLDGKNVLITGGTGSFGKRFVQRILEEYPNINKLIILSRDELKQFEMSNKYNESLHPGLRYILGDVRSYESLSYAFKDVDVVIHTAALKQVVAAEYNPLEFIKTNINGAENIVRAAIERKVSKVIALSTDKASAPVNLYGATKLVSDKIFTAANNMVGEQTTKFSVVRYGNVMGSRGSVIPFFRDVSKQGYLPITDPRMTRFNISLDDGINMVFWAIKNAFGGEIVVPEIPSYLITDLASAMYPELEQRNVGIRPGEKLHEQMIDSADSQNTLKIDKYYVILNKDIARNFYTENFNAVQVADGFTYDSGENPQFLTINEIQQLIEFHKL